MGSGLFKSQNSTSFFKRKNSLGLWSENEKIEIENATKTLKESAQFIANHFYYGVPVVITRKSIDPFAPIWVTPDTYKVMQRVEASEQLELQKDWEMIKNAPTTVMITHKGKVIVIFERSSIQYELSMNNIINSLDKNTIEIPLPSPPNLDLSTPTSLSLSWNLPDPPGISQYVEVQYRKYRLSLDPYILVNLNPPSSWSALVTRSWDKELFTSYHFTNLYPGISYQFRLRYRSHRGWSEYSPPSSLYRTLPDRPSTPQPPTSSVILPHAIHLSWSFPWHSGSLIHSFILEGKSVGEPIFHELFRGMNLSHIVFGLLPNNAYIFRLKAVNDIDESNYSEYYSIQTPAQYSLPLRLSDWRDDLLGSSDLFLQDSDEVGGSSSVDSHYYNAMRCRDAWRQFYDLQTQQIFYFNILTGSRQLQIPRALQQSQSQSLPSPTDPITEPEDNTDVTSSMTDQSSSTTSRCRKEDREVELEKNIQFRLKRFRFLKDLRSYRQEASPSTPVSLAAGTHTLSIDRQRIVYDTYSHLSTIRSGGVGGDLRKRFRIQFQNEIGIDSGGLTKEYFLLLSKQMIQYLLLWPSSQSSPSPPSPHSPRSSSMNRRKKWIKLTSSHKIFLNEVTHTDLEPQFQSKGRSSLETTNEENKSVDEESASFSTVIGNYQLLHGIPGKSYLRFVGRMIGKAIYDNQMIDIALSGILLTYMVTSPPLCCKTKINDQSDEIDNYEERMAEETKTSVWQRFIFNESDFKDYDSDLYNSLTWMMSNDITTAGLDETTFTVTDCNGNEIMLCKNGDKQYVTEMNKLEYVEYLIQWKIQYSVTTLLQEFLEGFWELIPLEVLKKNSITANDLDLMMNGKVMIDVEEIRAYTIFQGDPDFGDNHPQVIMFWQIIREIDSESQRKFLYFVTGTTRVPLDGYSPPFNLTQGKDMTPDSFPRAHTCFNQIVIPEYSSKEIMKEKILFALSETEGFHLA